MCLNSFLKASKGNNQISKSRLFHNVGAAYTKDISKNELPHVLLIGGTHNKQGSKDARVRIVVLLTLSLIKSHKYSGAVLLTALCVKSKIMLRILNQYNSLKTGVMWLRRGIRFNIRAACFVSVVIFQSACLEGYKEYCYKNLND